MEAVNINTFYHIFCLLHKQGTHTKEVGNPAHYNCPCTKAVQNKEGMGFWKSVSHIAAFTKYLLLVYQFCLWWNLLIETCCLAYLLKLSQHLFGSLGLCPLNIVQKSLKSPCPTFGMCLSATVVVDMGSHVCLEYRTCQGATYFTYTLVKISLKARLIHPQHVISKHYNLSRNFLEAHFYFSL